MPAHRRRNPFYVLLVPVGIAFVVTAFAYGLMAFQAVNAGPPARAGAAHPLNQWLRTHGNMALGLELAGLAVLTVAAMVTDRLWQGTPMPRDRFTPDETAAAHRRN